MSNGTRTHTVSTLTQWHSERTITYETVHTVFNAKAPAATKKMPSACLGRLFKCLSKCKMAECTRRECTWASCRFCFHFLLISFAGTCSVWQRFLSSYTQKCFVTCLTLHVPLWGPTAQIHGKPSLSCHHSLFSYQPERKRKLYTSVDVLDSFIGSIVVIRKGNVNLLA